MQELFRWKNLNRQQSADQGYQLLTGIVFYKKFDYSDTDPCNSLSSKISILKKEYLLHNLSKQKPEKQQIQ